MLQIFLAEASAAWELEREQELFSIGWYDLRESDEATHTCVKIYAEDEENWRALQHRIEKKKKK